MKYREAVNGAPNDIRLHLRLAEALKQPGQFKRSAGRVRASLPLESRTKSIRLQRQGVNS